MYTSSLSTYRSPFTSLIVSQSLRCIELFILLTIAPVVHWYICRHKTIRNEFSSHSQAYLHQRLVIYLLISWLWTFSLTLNPEKCDFSVILSCCKTRKSAIANRWHSAMLREGATWSHLGISGGRKCRAKSTYTPVKTLPPKQRYSHWDRVDICFRC